MTEKEAIKVIRKELHSYCESSGIDCFNSDCENCKIIVAYEKAIKALEKQIPKKTKQDEEYPLGRICPVCYTYLSNVQFVPSNYHYCKNCGQALDWGSEEE